MSRKSKKLDLFKVSLLVFIIVSIVALYLVLNKGHVFGIALVNAESAGKEEKLTQTIEIEAPEYISTKEDEGEEIIVKIDGNVVTEGIEYASSNEDVAKVEDGKIIALKNGKAQITAKVGDIADTVNVHAITPIKTIKFTSTSKSIRVGKELQMKLQVTPSDASVETLSYSSSDEEIATVDNSGIVTAVSKGDVTITVKDSYTGQEKSVSLIIK